MRDPAIHEACRAAGELGRRAAVAGGLVIALVSLLQRSPLWLASARGAATLLLLSLAARLGVAALARALDSDRARIQPKKGSRT